MTPIEPYKPSSTSGLLENIKNLYQEGRIKLTKKNIALVGTAALLAGGSAGAYVHFNRNHAPVINYANVSPQQVHILEDDILEDETSNRVLITADVHDPDEGDKGLDKVVREINGPSGKYSQEMEETNGLFSSTYKPEAVGNYTITITAFDGQGKKSNTATLKFEAITNYKPKVGSYEIFPGTDLYTGDSIEIIVNNVTDEIGIESAIFTMKNSDGEVTIINLDKANGSYKVRRKMDIPGDYDLEARFADPEGQVTIVDMGTLKVHPDNFPEILSYKVPRRVDRNNTFTVEGEFIDDLGVAEAYFDIPELEDFERVLLEKVNGTWEGRTKIPKTGTWDYVIGVVDTRGQETTTKEGTITVRTPSSGGVGGDGGDGCFTADTKVLMADGSFKPIVDIKENEEVQSFDFRTNNISKNKVTRLFKFDADSHLLINNNLKVTEKHPFAVGFDTWKEAGKLKIGDKVLGLKDIKLKSIKKVLKATQVFNLTVDGTHNYFVSDGKEVFLVHNKGGGS